MDGVGVKVFTERVLIEIKINQFNSTLSDHLLKFAKFFFFVQGTIAEPDNLF